MKKVKNWDLIITSRRGWLDFKINEIWYYRDLLLLLVKRDFTTFYKQTVLGPLWFLIQPAISTIVFTIIFNKIAKISTEEIPPELFYMSGIIAWNYFSTCLVSTSNTFTINATLFEKVYFPRIIFPLSKVISGLTTFFVQLLLFLAFYFFFMFSGNNYINPSLNGLLLLPLMIVQMALLGQGLGMILSSLTIKYRDLTYLISFGVQLLMYATPIVYPLSTVPAQYKIYISLNPMTSIIECFRQAFFGNGTLTLDGIMISTISCVITFIIGLLIFNKVERTFIDTV